MLEREQDAEAVRERVEEDGEHRRDQQRRDEPDHGADDLTRRSLLEGPLEPEIRFDAEQRRRERQGCGSGCAGRKQSRSRDGRVLGEHPGGAGEDEDAVEHAEDEADSGPDDPGEVSGPTDRPIGMRVHLGD